MKIVDLSPLRTRSRKENKTANVWLEHLQMILKYGWGWYQAHQAQEKAIRVLRQVLDNRFVLLRDLEIADGETPLPPVLVGPSGVYLVYVWPKAGSYRIREGQWEVMQGKQRRYRLGKPNVVQEVLRLQKQLEDFFSDVLGKHVAVTPLMVFTDPGADVASSRPKVRPLLLDGLRRYGAQLAKGETVLTPTDTMALMDAVRPRQVAAAKKQAGPRQRPRRRPPSQAPQQMQQAARYLNFTPRQWAILGGLAFLVLVVLALAIVYVLMTAH